MTSTPQSQGYGEEVYPTEGMEGDPDPNQGTGTGHKIQVGPIIKVFVLVSQTNITVLN